MLHIVFIAVINEKEDYKRIYIDLPGMGKSEGAEWIKSSDDMLDILINFIERIIPSENFLVVGQSYGGYLARGIIKKMSDSFHRATFAVVGCSRHSLQIEQENLFNSLVNDWIHRVKES